MATVSGTFTGTGNSGHVAGKTIAIDATFAGAATIHVQWLIKDSWRSIETFTESFQRVAEVPGNIPVRLHCSAHTNNVTYALTSGV